MATAKPKWQKVLYKDQNVADNYVDDTFLEELRKNVNTRLYEYWNVVCESGIFTQQVCSVLLFVALFIYIDDGRISASTMLVSAVCLLMFGYIAYVLMERRDRPSRDVSAHKRNFFDDCKSATLYLLFGFGLSPILMTLTETISTDTIYAMTTFMLLANVVFHDYGANAALVSQSLSLNAAIFAAVCLASRLASVYDAFVTLMWAVLVFALWPQFRQRVKAQIKGGHIFMTACLTLLTLYLLASVSTTAAVAFAILHTFVTFVCPYILVRLQQHKNNIYGPWDEAVVREYT